MHLYMMRCIHPCRIQNIHHYMRQNKCQSRCRNSFQCSRHMRFSPPL